MKKTLKGKSKVLKKDTVFMKQEQYNIYHGNIQRPTHKNKNSAPRN